MWGEKFFFCQRKGIFYVKNWEVFGKGSEKMVLDSEVYGVVDVNIYTLKRKEIRKLRVKIRITIHIAFLHSTRWRQMHEYSLYFK